MNTQRLFTRRQKQELYVMANGKCVICGIDLEKGWHADHIIPYSKEGETVLENGQALCKSCNLKKNNTYMQKQKLRPWQERYVQLPYQFYNEQKKSFLLNAGVGSGKTFGTAMASIPFIKEGFKLFIVSPLKDNKRNWALEFHKIGYSILKNYDFTYDYRRNHTGVSVTYNSLNEENVGTILRSGIIDKKTLFILDEIHHSGLKTAWGNSIQMIGDISGFVIALTGTPTRSDDQKIPFAKYEKFTDDGKYILKSDMTYSYGNSVEDKVCCPISFRSFDVYLEGVDGMLHDNEDHRRKLQSVLQVDQNNCVYDMVCRADVELDDLRVYKPGSAGLIICNTIENAKLIQQKLGSDKCDVVTSDENDIEDIDRFRNSDKKWLASVRMVSEGVDIPRLRFIVYATDVTTPLFFMQVAGRAVRNRNDNGIGTIDMCYFWYLNYEPLVNNAKQIEDEINHIIDQQYDEWPDDFPPPPPPPPPSSEPEYYEAEIGDINVNNGGIDLTDFLIKFRDKFSHSEWSEFERMSAEKVKYVMTKNGFIQIDDKTNQKIELPEDRNKELSKTVHRKVNELNALTKIPQNEIFRKYYKICGWYQIDKTNLDAVYRSLYKIYNMLIEEIKIVRNGQRISKKSA